MHAPEFPFERDAGNVADAIEENGLAYAVAQDNDFATWSAYGNQYWPAKYLIDARGQVRYTHFGEGRLRGDRAARSATCSRRPAAGGLGAPRRGEHREPPRRGHPRVLPGGPAGRPLRQRAPAARARDLPSPGRRQDPAAPPPRARGAVAGRGRPRRRGRPGVPPRPALRGAARLPGARLRAGPAPRRGRRSTGGRGARSGSPSTTSTSSSSCRGRGSTSSRSTCNPARRPMPSPSASPIIEPVTGEETTQGSILVVDDEPTIAEVVVPLPGARRVRPAVAADGPSAVAAVAASAAPDLVVLDLMLPGFDGLEVMRRLRDGRRPRTRSSSSPPAASSPTASSGCGAAPTTTSSSRSRPAELVARVDAVLRRATPARTRPRPTPLRFGSLEIDPPDRTALAATGSRSS